MKKRGLTRRHRTVGSCPRMTRSGSLVDDLPGGLQLLATIRLWRRRAPVLDHFEPRNLRHRRTPVRYDYVRKRPRLSTGWWSKGVLEHNCSNQIVGIGEGVERAPKLGINKSEAAVQTDS
jgi:hypothetical protein